MSPIKNGLNGIFMLLEKPKICIPRDDTFRHSSSRLRVLFLFKALCYHEWRAPVRITSMNVGSDENRATRRAWSSPCYLINVAATRKAWSSVHSHPPLPPLSRGLTQPVVAFLPRQCSCLTWRDAAAIACAYLPGSQIGPIEQDGA